MSNRSSPGRGRRVAYAWQRPGGVVASTHRHSVHHRKSARRARAAERRQEALNLKSKVTS